MTNSVVGNGIGKRFDDMLLADDIGKRLRAIFSIDCLGHEGKLKAHKVNEITIGYAQTVYLFGQLVREHLLSFWILSMYPKACQKGKWFAQASMYSISSVE